MTETEVTATPEVSLLGRAEDLAQIDRWFDEYDEIIEANEGEVPEELHQLFVEAYPNFVERIEACAARRKAWIARATIMKDEAARLTAKAKAISNREARMNRYMQLSMQIAKTPKVEGKFYDATLQNTKRTVTAPELPDLDTAKLFPRQLVRIIPPTEEAYAIDKDAVLDWVDAGKELPAGIDVTQGKTVVIR